MDEARKYGMIIFLVGLLGACSSGVRKPVLDPGSMPDANQLKGVEVPDWVQKGSGAFGGEEGKVFYGVASVSGIRNHSLARTTAVNRARAEIAKIFEVYSASLMKDYSVSTTTGDMSSVSEEQNVMQAVKTFSAQTLSGVQIVNHWYHPDGTIYALARLDLDTFGSSLDKMKELNGKVIRDQNNKTIVVLVKRRYSHPFLKKVITSSKKYHAHDEKNKFKIGDKVRIIESKPYSKKKRWKVIDK